MKKPTMPKLFWLPITAAVAALSQFAASGATSYSATILADNPVAYYRFEETSGTTNFDSTTNHFDGLLNQVTNQSGIAYPELAQPGISSNSILFRTSDALSGQQGNIDIPFNTTINGSTDGTNGAPFSAELWVQAITQPAGFEVPLDSSSPFTSGIYANSAGWNFYQTPGTNTTWSYSLRPNPGFVGNVTPVTLLQWTHLVLAYDGTNAHFYVNGAQTDSRPVPQYLADNGADMLVGEGPNTGQTPFNGYVDEVAIYNYALSPSQVSTHYTVGTNNIVAPPTPFFLAQPQSTTNFHGTTATFSATAGGKPPLYYQWKRGNALIAGATNTSYSLVCHYPADDQATFSVVVSNAFGSLTSATATLTVLTNENILNDPFSITREVGSYAAFRVNANGALPITYQWTVSTDGGVTFNPIAGATNDTLWLANVQTNLDQAMYVANVTGPFASVGSGAATLSVIPRAVIVPITGYARVVVADNPVGYWRLDETNGTTATDAVGSFDGTYLGSPSDYVFGYPTGIPHETDPAIHITNSANVSIPYALELNPVTGPWSYEFWILATSQNLTNYETPISSEGNLNHAGTTLSGWNIYQHVAGYWTWNIYNLGGNGSFTSEFVDHPVTGVWYHMVLTDDLTTFRWYSNNRLVFTYPVAGNFTQNGVNGDPSVGGAGPLTIGQRSDGVFGQWDGGVDEVAVYNYVLSPTQISNHFNNSTHVAIVRSGSKLIVTWPVGTLQAAPNVTGTYTNVPGATSPYTNSISGRATYFRVKVQ
jgi:hypothetical protein